MASGYSFLFPKNPKRAGRLTDLPVTGEVTQVRSRHKQVPDKRIGFTIDHGWGGESVSSGEQDAHPVG